MHAWKHVRITFRCRQHSVERPEIDTNNGDEDLVRVVVILPFEIPLPRHRGWKNGRDLGVCSRI